MLLAGYLEEILDAGGEHQVAVDLQLAGEEELRAGGIAGDQAQERDRLDLERDARAALPRVALHVALAAPDVHAVVVVAALRAVEDLPVDDRLHVAPPRGVEVALH